MAVNPVINNQKSWEDAINSTIVDYDTVLILESKKVIKELRVGINITYTYPREYFDKNKSVPTANIYYSDQEPAALYKTFKKLYQDQEIIRSDLAAACLYNLLKNEKILLTEDWISYGQLIGRKDTSVGISNILKINEFPDCQIQIAAGEISPEVDRMDIAYVICCLYRLIRSSQYPEYCSQLLKTMSKMTAGSTTNMDQLLVMNTSCSKWILDKNFTTLIAAIDMLYFRFPTGEFSYLRIGTIPSRFRDCAAVAMYQYIKDIVSAEMAKKFYTWLLTDRLATDFIRMFATSEEEFHEIYSYFPYQVDMNMVLKTAYSVSSNPSIYTFCAVIGTMLGDLRCKAARFVPGIELTEVMYNALLIAYVNRHCSRLYQKVPAIVKPPVNSLLTPIQGNEQPEDNDTESDQEEDDIENGDDYYPEDLDRDTKIPDTPAVGPWLIFMHQRNNKFTDTMKNWFRSVGDKLVNSRSMSIAEYLHRNIAELILD